jgi:translation initiation factor IF-2
MGGDVSLLFQKENSDSIIKIEISCFVLFCFVIAFNAAASFATIEDANNQKIPIEYYIIVYKVIESYKSKRQEVLSPTPVGEYSGSASVQDVFNIGGTGNIAGIRCNDGVL